MNKDRFKFRVFDKICKKNTEIKQDPAFNFFFGESKEMIIQQSTGFRDINGKLIYEGDIVRIKTKREQTLDYVEYDEELVSLRFSGIGGEDYCDLIDYKNAGATFEVIGNIYENEGLYKQITEEK